MIYLTFLETTIAYIRCDTHNLFINITNISMNIEQTLKHLIQEAVREVIEEEIQRGRLLPAPKPKLSKPSTLTEPLIPRDPNAIVRPAELADMLSISRSTLWRWEQDGRLPSKLRFSANITGWRYRDIEAWLDQI